MGTRLTPERTTARPGYARRPECLPRREALTCALAASWAALALGCGAPPEGGPNPSPAASGGAENIETAPPENGPGGAAGTSLAEEFAELSLSSTGNPFTNTPPDSECDQWTHLHTLKVTSASRSISWDLCARQGASDPFEIEQGARALDANELAAVTAAYAMMTLRSGPACGSDAPFITLDVEANGSIERYADERQCPPRAYSDRAYVSGVWELWEMLRGLVP